MANVKRSGKSWVVKHGKTGKVLSRHKKRDAAFDSARDLHKKNNVSKAVREIK